MVREAEPIDISDVPELSELVREVVETGESRLLQVEGHVARLSPARRRRRRSVRRPTQEEFEADMKATSGAWKDWLDPDEFKRQRRELQIHDREPRIV